MLSATAKRFCRRFSLAEIELATGNFSEDQVIGKGGFGNVYKGLIDNDEVSVAIKRLASNSNQGEQEFVTEIETLSKLRHVNLVSLVGYCNDHNEMILVYEFVSRGTLADHLYNDRSSSLAWNQRLRICIGAARGLDYLHTGTSIIHRDVKSANILLDEDFTPKVSDFGLAKHLSTSNASKGHVSTIVKGSFGYLDPSYFITGKLTRNSDAYAFGVVLLEVLCGRPAVDPSLADHGESLVIWAKSRIRRGKVDQIVASNLRNEITGDCLKTFVGVAKRCLHPKPQKRPTMGEAVIELQLALKQQERRTSPTHIASMFAFWNSLKPTASHASGSSQQDHNQVETYNPSTVVPIIQEDAFKDEHTVDMLPLDEAEDILGNMLPIAVPAISIHKLVGITNGEGSNESEYHGFINGQAAAIKKLSNSSLPNHEFIRQVSIASNLKHENVVQLLGYCVDGVHRFFAYEFAPYGTLHDLLHRRQGVGSQSWSKRVRIAVGAAKGLEYIHEKGLIHGDIRSRNISLFDQLQVAKIAHHVRPAQLYPYHSTILKMGCYDAPEYTMSGQCSRRSDVYSFGVVLLELLTGREPLDYTWLDTWARPRLHKDRVSDVVDTRLRGDYPLWAVATMAEVASRCVQYEPCSRPNISQVVNHLQPLLTT